MKKVIINLLANEKYELPNECIYVDELIADTIITLLNKGYKTIASCSAHAELKLDQFLQKAPKSDFEKLIGHKHIFVVNEDEDYVEFYSEIMGSNSYIMFEEEYEFEFLPDGFVYEDKSITKDVLFYDENDRRKSKEQIEEEIKQNCKALYEWANKLDFKKERIL